MESQDVGEGQMDSLGNIVIKENVVEKDLKGPLVRWMFKHEMQLLSDLAETATQIIITTNTLSKEKHWGESWEPCTERQFTSLMGEPIMLMLIDELAKVEFCSPELRKTSADNIDQVRYLWNVRVRTNKPHNGIMKFIALFFSVKMHLYARRELEVAVPIIEDKIPVLMCVGDRVLREMIVLCNGIQNSIVEEIRECNNETDEENMEQISEDSN